MGAALQWQLRVLNGQRLVDVQRSGSDSDQVASARQLQSGRAQNSCVGEPAALDAFAPRHHHVRTGTSIAVNAMDLTAGQ